MPAEVRPPGQVSPSLDCFDAQARPERGTMQLRSLSPNNLTSAFQRSLSSEPKGSERLDGPSAGKCAGIDKVASEAMINSPSLPGEKVDLFGSASLQRNSGFEPVCHQASPERRASTHSAESVRSRRRSSGILLAEEPKMPPSRIAQTSSWVLELKASQVFMICLTIAILYCGDVIQATFEVSADRSYAIILWLCLVIFSVEWSLQVLASPAQAAPYVCSLFFFLDALATLSIAVDIFLLQANNLMENGPIARAARAARIGTRAGRSMRLLRLMRFLRLVRITRFIKTLLQHRNEQRKRRRSWLADEDFDPKSHARADTIGAQIGATTTKKVIIMTLMLLVILPLLERNMSFHTCNAELVVVLESLYSSTEVQGNCTRLKLEVEPWFSSGFIPFSRHPKTGLTKSGMMHAQVDRCVLYSNYDLMGDLAPEQVTLAKQRRGTEIQVIPCSAVFADSNRDGVDERRSTYLLYDMRKEEQESARYAIGFTTVVVVILLGFSLIFSQDAEVLANQLVTPIVQLMNDMSHTAQLRLDQVTPQEDVLVSNVYEVRRLQAVYMQLNAAVGSFAKFTPLEVVRHFLSLGLEAQLGVEQRNVSIFFSDIAGFTTICEGSPPVEVLALLSEYFESMVSIIVEEYGTMLEFIGDAILAIWNAPNSVPDHAVRAITSALRMNSVLAQLRRRWSEQGKPIIRIRVGLHSADVFVGNLGSKMRMKYGVLGDGVNLASRLEELNKRYQTEILISEFVLAQPDVKGLFYVRPVDNVVVKGRVKPTAIYEVLCLREAASELHKQIANHSEQAMRAYTNRDFAEALTYLDTVSQLKDGRDPTGEVLADRCRKFIDFPPGENWDGSEILNQKSFGKAD